MSRLVYINERRGQPFVCSPHPFHRWPLTCTVQSMNYVNSAVPNCNPLLYCCHMISAPVPEVTSGWLAARPVGSRTPGATQWSRRPDARVRVALRERQPHARCSDVCQVPTGHLSWVYCSELSSLLTCSLTCRSLFTRFAHFSGPFEYQLWLHNDLYTQKHTQVFTWCSCIEWLFLLLRLYECQVAIRNDIQYSH